MGYIFRNRKGNMCIFSFSQYCPILFTVVYKNSIPIAIYKNSLFHQNFILWNILILLIRWTHTDIIVVLICIST